MEKFIAKWHFKLAKWLFDHYADCSACDGRGFIYSTKKLDAITNRDISTVCYMCDGYGHKLNAITRLAIKGLPE